MEERDTLAAARDDDRGSVGSRTVAPAHPRVGIVGAGVRALASSGPDRVGTGPDRVGTVPFVYRFHPVVREARARVRSGSLGPVRPITGGYVQDWLASAEDDNWRIAAAQGGASRAFADIGSHWCDLTEPITGERITAICAQTATVFRERADGGTAGAFAAGGSTGSRRAVGKASVRFEQERPETLWLGRRGVSEIVTRDPGGLGAEAAPYAVAPAGHPQGYLDCFDLFVADSYAAMRGEGAPLGLPTFADGARSAHLIDAVLASAAAGEWVEVP